MTKYKQVKGNLLDLFEQGEFDAIAHGCNCFNSMGAGIAAQIAIRFPQAKQADDLTTPGDLLKLGSLSLAVTQYGVIYNLYTQYHGGSNLDFDALRLSMRKMANMIKDKNWRIGFPLIGAGIAGGDWNKIQRVIKQEFKHENVTIVILK